VNIVPPRGSACTAMTILDSAATVEFLMKAHRVIQPENGGAWLMIRELPASAILRISG